MEKLNESWRKSTRSGTQGACVEVRLVGNQIEVRDTKAAGSGPVLGFTAQEWSAFVEGAKAGEFEI